MIVSTPMLRFELLSHVSLSQGITKQIGGQTHDIAAKLDTYMRGMVSDSSASLFEELGMYYIGPVDGHNVEDLVHVLKKIKGMPNVGPVLIHVITEKGKGYAPAESAPDKMHGTIFTSLPSKSSSFYEFVPKIPT